MPPDTRDAVMDCIQRWSGKTEIRPLALVGWLDLGRSKYYAWKNRYGKAHEHNAWIPRDHWLETWEREAILSFYRQYPEEGYRRQAFMMLDRDGVAVSPTSVAVAGARDHWTAPPSRRRFGMTLLQPI